MTDAQFERAWLDVPERLGRDAFIVPHVLELLPLPAENLIVEGNLHRIINRNYFNSYAMDYSCAVFQRMSALGGRPGPVRLSRGGRRLRRFGQGV
jgi:hypothetical protein